MKTLTIKLAGPLQSYGNEATFNRRTSNDYPTKSAVIGLVAAALGYHRNDSRITELAQLNFAVRIDQPGVSMTDFQTVKYGNKGSKLTYRDYLQDAVFVAALSGDDQQIDEIAYALKHPQFQLFLGRRSNAPAGVLKLFRFSEMNAVQALERLEWQASSWYQRRYKTIKTQIIADASLLPEKRNQMVKDQVISFAQTNRQLGFRAIAIKRIDLEQRGSQLSSVKTSHDAFAGV